MKSIHVLSEALDADIMIAVPKGKSHSSSGVSLSNERHDGTYLRPRGPFTAATTSTEP